LGFFLTPLMQYTLMFLTEVILKCLWKNIAFVYVFLVEKPCYRYYEVIMLYAMFMVCPGYTIIVLDC